MYGPLASRFPFLIWRRASEKAYRPPTAASGSSARSASASSMVRLLRRLSSSLCGPPGPKRSSYLRISMRLAPKVWRLPMMLLLKPVTMATIAITVVTPTTIPRTVRVERSLCSRMELAEKRTLPAKPRMNGTQALSRASSLIPQRLHRGELGRGGRGRQAGREARDRRRREADQDEAQLHLRGEDLVHGQGHQRSRHHAARAAERRQQRRLHQELPLDVALPRPQRHAQPDLRSALHHRDEHDVGDHDAADHQGQARDEHHDREGGRGDRTPQRLDGFRADHAEWIFGGERRPSQGSQQGPDFPLRLREALHAADRTHHDRDPVVRGHYLLEEREGHEHHVVAVLPQHVAELGLEPDDAERIAADVHRAADGVEAREELVLDVVADDGYRRPLLVFQGGEEAARLEGHLDHGPDLGRVAD